MLVLYNFMETFIREGPLIPNPYFYLGGEDIIMMLVFCGKGNYNVGPL